MVTLWTKHTAGGTWNRIWKIALVVGAVGTGAGLLFWRRNLQGRAMLGRGTADVRLKATRTSNGRKRRAHSRIR